MRLGAFLVVLALPLSALAADAGYRIGAQIVVDTSARMAVKLGDKPVYRWALEAALKTLEAHDQLSTSVELTWRTLGGGQPDSEEESTCETTQLLVPQGVTPGPVVRSLAPTLVARGPRPLSAGLTAAMADLPHDPGVQRAVILITNGVDECGYDVCLTASEIRGGDGLGLVHVILVNPAGGTEQKLQCLGKVTVVHDALALSKAVSEALGEVLDPATITIAATKDGAEVPATAEMYAPGDKQPVVRTRSGVPVQVAGGIYDVRVIKTVKPRDDDEPIVVDPSAEGIRQHVEIASGGQLVVRVPLGGQRGHIIGTVLFNGEDAPEGTRIAVFRAGDTEAPLVGGAPGEPIAVPPGRYDLRATIPGGPTGNIEVWKPEVSVTAGGATTVTLAAAQRRGTVLVKVTSGGQPIDGASFSLSPAGGDDNAADYPAGTELQVPAGKYRLRARLVTPVGDLAGTRDSVTVAPNHTAELTVDIGPTALLTVEITDHSLEEGITVALVRGSAEPALMPAFSPTRVPPGKYGLRVQTQQGAADQSGTIQARIELRAGETHTVHLSLP